MRKITYFSVFINTVFVSGEIDLVESTDSDARVLFIETNLFHLPSSPIQSNQLIEYTQMIKVSKKESKIRNKYDIN